VEIEEFERRLREDIVRFDAWLTKPKTRKGTKRMAAKKR
jgi:hypothetical protein